MAALRPLALVAFCACLQPGSLAGSEMMDVKVTPRVAVAPAVIMVRTVLASDADNRALVVTAESDDFYRSSRLQLDGEKAPRVNEVRMTDLPPGLYRVTVSLVGQHGQRAEASNNVRLVGLGQ